MEVRPLSTETVEWDAFVRSNTYGSPFHLLAWKRAIETAFGHRSHYLVATGPGGVEGVLPLFEVPGLLGGRGLISVPYGVYGGICATTPEARTALLEAAGRLARERGAGYVELRHRSGQEVELPTKSLYVRFARSISADPEENMAAIPRKQRRMTRQGAKFGLRSELGLQHLDAFYEVYAESVRNLGSPVFPRALFHAIAQEFKQECDLLTVWREGQLLAGVLTLLYEDQALPYYGGARREGHHFAVNDFMYWELMCRVAAAGCRVFDFGRSREGTGAYHFKRHWGFEPEPLPYQYVLRGGGIPNLSPSNPKLRLAVAAWKRAPLGLTKWLGPRLTRYLP
ncbi:MAG TPA: FemAB family XrtA/PEP-CTERM system-associated protein [Methylomirabilota bacterium]|nr:FemAB family XrtA/PEP-CTERM system-associated protein [Methylomirabilota bacterium]